MKALLTLLMALLAVPFTLANNPNPNDDPNDDLFDYAYGLAPKETTVTTYNCTFGEPTNESTCLARAKADIAGRNSTTIYAVFKSSSFDEDPVGSGRFTLAVIFEQCQINSSTGDRFSCRDIHTTPIYRSRPSQQIAQSCPPDGTPQSTYKANVGDAPFCFDPTDLSSRDSCPDSTQDGNFVLPLNGNTAASVCQLKPDGSQCKYTLQGDHYVTDFENNCYASAADPYDETGITTPDPDSQQQCQDIGNGIGACVEDPVNVCNNGTCQEGCGSVAIGDADPVFVCLSPDTDGDGIGDYADPDIDGDGIRNEDDLDYDGDGVEDPTYDNPGTQNGNVSVSIDSGAIGRAAGDAVADKLIETGDFDTSEYEARVDAKSSDLDTQIDTLLDDENFELTGIIDDTGFNNSLDTLTSALNPTTCVNSIMIPFVNEPLDFCSAADRAKPFLYFIFAASTVLYCWRRAISAIKED
jgi:hypothetical protein